MGWVRNYHAYGLMDTKDGALWGPTKSTAIDTMHLQMMQRHFMDDRKYKVGDLLSKPGETLVFMYDLGDQWAHNIELLEIFSEEDSTGKVVLESGAMNCPPEDSNGLAEMGLNKYEDFIIEFEGTGRKGMKAKRKKG